MLEGQMSIFRRSLRECLLENIYFFILFNKLLTKKHKMIFISEGLDNWFVLFVPHTYNHSANNCLY